MDEGESGKNQARKTCHLLPPASYWVSLS